MKFFNSWQIFAFASALFAGLTALLGKIGVSNINSNLATLIRVVVILMLTVLIVFATHQWQRPQTINVKTWIFLILSGITTALSWLCYYRALQLGPISKVVSIDKLSVAIAILLGILLLGEKFSWQVLLGGGLITVGAVLIAVFN
jgi:transporter family protein